MRPTPLWNPGPRRGVLKPPPWEPRATLNTRAPEAGISPRAWERNHLAAAKETRDSHTPEPTPACPLAGEPGARSWEGALGSWLCPVRLVRGLPFRAKEGIPGPLGGALFPPFKPEAVGRGRGKAQPRGIGLRAGAAAFGAPGGLRQHLPPSPPEHHHRHPHLIAEAKQGRARGELDGRPPGNTRAAGFASPSFGHRPSQAKPIQKHTPRNKGALCLSFLLQDSSCPSAVVPTPTQK